LKAAVDSASPSLSAKPIRPPAGEILISM